MNSLPEKFSLKWNDYEYNLKSTLRLVKTNEDFCDVTVCVEDNSQFEAHKVVLAAGSDFFSDVLRKAKHPHPFIYLKGVQAEQMEAILNFFYSGEASVAQLDLSKFLQVAQDLKVKGLAEGVVDKGVPQQRVTSAPLPPPQQSSFVAQISEPEQNIEKVEHLVNIAPAQQPQTVFTDFKTEHDVEEIQEIQEIYETEDPNVMHEVYEDTTIVETTVSVPTEYLVGHQPDNDHYLVGHQPDRDPERPFFCEKCWKNFKSKASLKDHISWVHTGADIIYSCTMCGKTDMTKKGLANHKYIKHSEGKGARSRKLKANVSNNSEAGIVEHPMVNHPMVNNYY